MGTWKSQPKVGDAIASSPGFPVWVRVELRLAMLHYDTLQFLFVCQPFCVSVHLPQPTVHIAMSAVSLPRAHCHCPSTYLEHLSLVCVCASATAYLYCNEYSPSTVHIAGSVWELTVLPCSASGATMPRSTSSCLLLWLCSCAWSHSCWCVTQLRPSWRYTACTPANT